MHTSFYTVEGPWQGWVAMAARPNGGDALHSEVVAWRGSHLNTVVSVLVSREAAELGLQDEEDICFLNQIDFLSFPIADHGVPESYVPALDLIRNLDARLSRGENILIHGRQGIGRATLIAAGLLVYRGFDHKKALQRATDARGMLVPETREQTEWLGGLGSCISATPVAG